MTTTTELLEALERYLRGEVQDELEGALAFQNRIATNLTGMLRREKELAPSLAALDAQFAAQQGFNAAELPSALARALRDRVEVGDSDLRQYLRRRVLPQLAIDNPRYSGFKQAQERWPEARQEEE